MSRSRTSLLISLHPAKPVGPSPPGGEPSGGAGAWERRRYGVSDRAVRTSFRTAHAVRNAADLALSIDHGRAAVIALDAQHVASAGLLRCRHLRGEAEQGSKDQHETGASQDVFTHVELLSEKPFSPSWAARAAAQLLHAPTGCGTIAPRIFLCMERTRSKQVMSMS